MAFHDEVVDECHCSSGRQYHLDPGGLMAPARIVEKWWRDHHRARLVVYISLVLMIAFGFYRVEKIADDAHAAGLKADRLTLTLERESLQRDRVVCRGQNEVRQGIRDFLAALSVEDGTVTIREQSVLDAAAIRFAALDCPPEPNDEGER
jgi:hypothetical protein